MDADNDSESAYRRGYSHGADDATNAVSTPAHEEFDGDDTYYRGYADGLRDQQAAMAGYVAGVADERGHVNSTVPVEYQGNQAYADAYQTAEATAAGYDAGVADARDHVSAAVPSDVADSESYTDAYRVGQTAGDAQERQEEDRVAAYAAETERRLAEEKARRPFDHMNDPDSIYYQKPETPEEMTRRIEEDARRTEAEENEQVMWPDGSVSTRKEHEAREFREGLEQLETLGGVGEMHNPHGVGGGIAE